MFHVGTGHSTAQIATVAAQELIMQCKMALPPVANPNAGILFASPHYDHQMLLTTIYAEWPNLNLIGCTVPTCISNHKTTLNFDFNQPEPKHYSVTLMVFQSDQVVIKAAYIDKLSDCYNETAVQTKIQAAIPDLPQAPALCVTLLPFFTLQRYPFSISERRLIKLFSKVLGQHIPLLGGAAGADIHGDCVRLFYDKTVNHNDGLVFLLFSEPLQVSIAAIPGLNDEGGWRPIDAAQPAMVQDDVHLLKVGHEDAKTFYDYPNRSATWLLQPLCVQEGDENYLIDVNYPASTHQTDNTMLLFNQIPDGVGLQNTVAPSPDKLLQLAQKNIQKALATYKTTYTNQIPHAALVFSCIKRLCLLKLYDYAIEAELGELNQQAKFVGFHAYGEVGKLNHENNSEYHSSSLFVVFFGEKVATLPQTCNDEVKERCSIINLKTSEAVSWQIKCETLEHDLYEAKKTLAEYDTGSNVKFHKAKVRERAKMALCLSLLLKILIEKKIVPYSWCRGENLNFDHISRLLAEKNQALMENRPKETQYRFADILKVLYRLDAAEVTDLELLMRYMKYEINLDDLKKMEDKN